MAIFGCVQTLMAKKNCVVGFRDSFDLQIRHKFHPRKKKIVNALRDMWIYGIF